MRKIISVSRADGTEEEVSFKRFKEIVKKNYNDGDIMINLLLEGKIESIKTSFSNFRLKREECKATLEVDFGKYFDEGNRKKVVLECCLFHPHPKHKHFNSRLLLTCGGMNIPDEEGIKDWSAWVEKIGEPMPEWRKQTCHIRAISE